MSNTQRTAEMDVETILNVVCDLAEHVGAVPLNQFDGAWIHRIDERWTIAVNAHERTVHVAPAGMMAIDVPPFDIAVWFDGWLAGQFSPAGGWFASGEAGNAQAFMAALGAARSNT